MKKGQEIFVSKPSTSQVKTSIVSETEVKQKWVVKKMVSNYEVQPKETLYSLSKKFDINQEELIKLNPDLQDGLKIGMILKVPSSGTRTFLSKTKDSVLVAKNKVNLIASVDKSKQKNLDLS